jgi:ribosomal protein S12 methylthiotransferase accessory factor
VSAATQEALTRARRIVSPRSGIVSRVVLRELAADDPPFYWAATEPASLLPIADRPALNSGNGASVDRDRAILKAVGESVERYCSALFDERELRLATWDELPGAAVPPERFALFSERQYATPGFRFAPFTRETRVGWVRGHSLVRDRPTWVPATLVYVPYKAFPGEPAIADCISTGLAAGPTLAAAAYRAVVEAIERDAFMIVWQNRLARPQIDLDEVEDPDVLRLLRAFSGIPVRLRAVCLGVDIEVPVVLVTVTGEPGRPPLTIAGFGADLSPTRALALALEEVALGFIGFRRAVAATPEYRPEPGYSDLVDLGQHALAHALDPALASSLDFLLEGGTVTLADLPDRAQPTAARSLRAVVDAVAAAGLDVVAVDLTTPDVDEAGFKVVRCVVPGLQPLDINHNERHLGGRRLYEVPHRLGLAPEPPGEDDLNPDPHPFP